MQLVLLEEHFLDYRFEVRKEVRVKKNKIKKDKSFALDVGEKKVNLDWA